MTRFYLPCSRDSHSPPVTSGPPGPWSWSKPWTSVSYTPKSPAGELQSHPVRGLEPRSSNPLSWSGPGPSTFGTETGPVSRRPQTGPPVLPETWVLGGPVSYPAQLSNQQVRNSHGSEEGWKAAPELGERGRGYPNLERDRERRGSTKGSLRLLPREQWLYRRPVTHYAREKRASRCFPGKQGEGRGERPRRAGGWVGLREEGGGRGRGAPTRDWHRRRRGRERVADVTAGGRTLAGSPAGPERVPRAPAPSASPADPEVSCKHWVERGGSLTVLGGQGSEARSGAGTYPVLRREAVKGAGNGGPSPRGDC